MVGVPGRSKGCNTCLKRRVKCDETKPSCQRCARAGFPCLGYARETLWRHTSAPALKSPRSSSPGGNRHDTAAMLEEEPRCGSARAAPVSNILELRRRVGDVGSAPGSDFGLSSAPLFNQPSLAAFADDLCVAHMFSNYVWRSYGAGWLEPAAQGRLGPLATDAIAALAQASFGRANGLPDLALRGCALYGVCLRRLAGELSSEVVLARSGGPALLVPILVLMLYATSDEDRTGARFHLRGIAKLLSMCDPKMFQRQPLLNAFESCRATLLISCLTSRKRLFLEDERWRKGPWALDPDAKSPQSAVLDILVTVPGLLEDLVRLDRITSAENSPILLHLPHISACSRTRPSHTRCPDPPHPYPHPLSESILTRLATQLEILYSWRWRWQAAYGHQVLSDHHHHHHHYPSHRSGGRISNTGSTGSTGNPLNALAPLRPLERLIFTRPAAAAEIMFYNATLMWLLALLWKLAPTQAAALVANCAERAMHASVADAASPGSPGVQLSRYMSFAPLSRPGAACGLRGPAVEIARAFEWESLGRRRREGHGGDGDDDVDHDTGGGGQACGGMNVLYLFPMGMAMTVLREEAAGRKWVRALLDVSPFTKGYGGYGAEDDEDDDDQGDDEDSVDDESDRGEGAELEEEEQEEVDGRRAYVRPSVAGFGFYVTSEALRPDTAGTVATRGVCIGQGTY